MRNRRHQRYLTDSSFEAELQRSAIPLLVAFWAEWSGGCYIMAPILDSIGESLDGRIKVIRMDIEKCSRTAQDFGVQMVPTLLLFRRGKLVDSISGIAPRSALLRQVLRNIDPADSGTVAPVRGDCLNPKQKHENQS